MEKLHLIQDEPSHHKVKLEIERFKDMSKNSSEYHKTQTWLDDVFSFPWQTSTPLFWDLKYTGEVLDKRVFGLEKVKQRILEMISSHKIRQANEQSKVSNQKKALSFCFTVRPARARPASPSVSASP